MNARNGCLLALLTLLTACAREDGADRGSSDAEASAAAVAPAIVAPSETADPAQPPSYEVAIASAAAGHNKSIDRCERQPEAVRTQCEQEANAAFAETETSLDPLRGNKQ
jgi:uncharacterized lipoprotein